ncbi:hypothetical protein [Microbacterium enclense]|uniref:hypothetical protein n=1 Tax=Microbacterium enclense TaxID=993073 RepID=UPI003D70CF95
MHEPSSADPPSARGVGTAPVIPPARPRPSRLVPFLVCGSTSVILFAVASALRRGHDPVLSDLGAFCCLGACLSGVAAAIFGCVTLTRAIRARAAGAAL